MQLRQSSFKGFRPPCPVDPGHPVHVHGHYERLAQCDGNGFEDILRFLCYRCGHTISVLPDHRLPYRAVSVTLLEQDLDARSHQTEPPATTEKEKSGLQRAWLRFTQRRDALARHLGQMLRCVNLTPAHLWFQLRPWGDLATILLRLARPFYTSLLHDYRCLLPWSAPSP